MADKRGWIYVVSGAGLYKIGRTSTPRGAAGRLSSLQGSSPVPLTLEMSFEVELCYVTERMLHDRFKHKAVSGVGREWFALDSTDLEWIRGLDVDAQLSRYRADRRPTPVVRFSAPRPERSVNNAWLSLDPTSRSAVSSQLARWGSMGGRAKKRQAA